MPGCRASQWQNQGYTLRLPLAWLMPHSPYKHTHTHIHACVCVRMHTAFDLILWVLALPVNECMSKVAGLRPTVRDHVK